MKSVVCLVAAALTVAEETDTLLQASRLQKHEKGEDEPEDDLTDDSEDDADDMPLNTEELPFEIRGGESDNLPCNSGGVIFKNIEEDCTHQDLYTWKGEVQGDFVAPTYNPEEYGSDAMWSTSKVNGTSGWETLCVAYVNTKKHKKTCKQWCKDQSTKDQKVVCNKGMDDAHLQTEGLYKWLGDTGYKQTKCTVNPATRLLTAKLSNGKPIDQSENGCNAKWDTQICGCALVRPDPPSLASFPLSNGYPLCSWVKTPPPGKLPRLAIEECSYGDHHVWKGDIQEFTPPTYSPTIYGSDDMWTTGPGLGHETLGKWAGACVAYVKTGGRTCTQWCAMQEMHCVGGMDDAHHQRDPLNKWQAEAGFPNTKCTLFEKGHTRQTTENNGCEQKWKTQVCACKGAL